MDAGKYGYRLEVWDKGEGAKNLVLPPNMVNHVSGLVQ